jgi:hypothetical protein
MRRSAVERTLSGPRDDLLVMRRSHRVSLAVLLAAFSVAALIAQPALARQRALDAPFICPGTVDTRPGNHSRRPPPKDVIAVWVVDQNNCLLVVKAVEILKTTDGYTQTTACPVECGLRGDWTFGDFPSGTSWTPGHNGSLWYQVTITKAAYFDTARRRAFGRCTTTRRFPLRYTNPGEKNFIRYRCTA